MENVEISLFYGALIWKQRPQDWGTWRPHFSKFPHWRQECHSFKCKSNSQQCVPFNLQQQLLRKLHSSHGKVPSLTTANRFLKEWLQLNPTDSQIKGLATCEPLHILRNWGCAICATQNSNTHGGVLPSAMESGEPYLSQFSHHLIKRGVQKMSVFRQMWHRLSGLMWHGCWVNNPNYSHSRAFFLRGNDANIFFLSLNFKTTFFPLKNPLSLIATFIVCSDK